MSAARVVLAEPDTPTRMGVRMALTRGGFEIVAEAREAGTAVEAALRERPELAVLAVDLPGDGIAAARAIASGLAAIRIVVLTGQSRLPRAVEGVLAGEAAVPRGYTEHILEALRGRHARRGAGSAAHARLRHRPAVGDPRPAG